MKPNHRSVDEWLDAVLKQYGEVEPRQGLENRILTTVRAERERLAAQQWTGWLALAAAACMLIGAAVFVARKPSTLIPLSVASHPGVSSQKAERPMRSGSTGVPPAVSGTSRHRPAQEIASSGSRLGQLPSPRPSSQQERLLLAYVNQASEEEVAAVIARNQSIEELVINELQIPPLLTATLNENKDAEEKP